MLEKFDERITVLAVYDSVQAKVVPRKFKWQGRTVVVKEVGYYHRRRAGRMTEHVFDVTDGGTAYRLICNGDTLLWILEEVSDGN